MAPQNSSMSSATNTSPSSGLHIHSPLDVLQKIPSEIWSMIFVHCLLPHLSLNDKIDRLKNGLGDARLAPMTIASVCRTWRYDACNTPQLWSTCWLNFLHPELNTVWLRRAGKLLLYLYGVLPEPELEDAEEEETDWDPILHSILPFQTQWESIDLGTVNDGVVSVVPEFDAPALKVFRLLRGRMPVWGDKLLRGCPQVRELDLYASWSGIGEVRFPVLSTITIQMAPVENIYSILSALPQLQHLDIDLFDDLGNSMLPGNLAHSSLLSLRVAGEFSGSLLLDGLTLPSLRVIRLHLNFEPSAFLDFLRRSQCCIIALGLGDTFIPSSRLISILQDPLLHFSIERLEFTTSEMEFPFPLEILNFLQGIRNLPHLTQLAFSHHLFRSIPDGLLVDLVISRCSARTCVCERCIGSEPRMVWLKHVSIEYLERNERALDIARLVPLPGNRRRDCIDVSTVLELVFMDWLMYPVDEDALEEPFGYPENIQSARFLIGKPPPCMNDFGDDL